jgi:hypothetical protein
MKRNDRGDRRRERSRSDSRDRKHRRSSYDAGHPHATAQGSPHAPATAMMPRQPLSAKVIAPADLDVNCCLRIGVINPPAPVTREQVLNEIEAVKLLAQVETVVMEPHREGANEYWANVYFSTPADANRACAELNVPLRTYRWKEFVTQRLPLPGSLCGEVGTIPIFEAFNANPPDTVVVDTQEGYVFFSTDELYRTRGAEEFVSTKRKEGKIVRRLICKHFDPERRIPCRYGLQCMFVHVKACAMPRLLRTVTAKQKLRFPKNETDIQVSSWDFERRADTLVVRGLDLSMDAAQIQYMFEGCAGYRESFVGTTNDGMRFGAVRFSSRIAAFDSLVQTVDSGLSVSYYGCMEDIRRIMLHDPECKKLAATNNNQVSQPSAATQRPAFVTQTKPAAPQRPAEEQREESSEPRTLPFPPLPAGWDYGESRKTNQYYFFQPKTKNPTTWQHPVTREHYTF